jgi:hypothetical protein
MIRDSLSNFIHVGIALHAATMERGSSLCTERHRDVCLKSRSFAAVNATLLNEFLKEHCKKSLA